MERNAKFSVKMLQMTEHTVMYCGCSGRKITHKKGVAKGVTMPHINYILTK